MKRYLFDNICADLRRKMVFLTGPRQVGKTFLARQVMTQFDASQYLNYDNYVDRKIVDSQTWDRRAGLVVLDEIHKMRDWKRFLKGVYDTRPDQQALLITGSARMDTFRQSGESLAGRYYHYHLHPLSVRELAGTMPSHSALENLMRLSGFPEPFLAGSDTEAARWRNQYHTDLVREDVVEFGRVQEIRVMRLLLEALRNRVGAPLSYSALAEDLKVAPNTIRRYVDILESLHVVMLVRPHHRNIARALQKEPKLYFSDCGLAVDESRRLENAVALALKKHVDYARDALGRMLSLHYLRDKEKREVDFVLVEDGAPILLLEVKLGDDTVASALKYYHSRFPEVEAVQLVMRLRQSRSIDNIRIVSASDWLAELSA